MSDDPDSPRVLGRFQNEIDAQLVVNHLQSLGIQAKVYAALASVWPEVPPDVQVIVSARNLERAQAARAEIAKMNSRLG